jgi:hypothetical protein
MREGVVAVKPFAVGKDALVDGREAKPVGDLLNLFFFFFTIKIL